MVVRLVIVHFRDLSEANLALKGAITLLPEYKRIIFNKKPVDLTAYSV